MITKRELLRHVLNTKIRADLLEKHYIMELILVALEECPSASGKFFLKGGSAVHMCFEDYAREKNGRFAVNKDTIHRYFSEGRFSGDIDLTTVPDMMDEKKLRRAFHEVSDWMVRNMEIEMPKDGMSFPVHNQRKNPERRNVRGEVKFKGPLFDKNKNFGLSHLKIDISDNDALVLPSARSPIFYPFSDISMVGRGYPMARTYDFAEVFAEKFRAFNERSSAKDMYDVVNMAKGKTYHDNFGRIVACLGPKFERKKMTMPESLGATMSERRGDIQDSWDDHLMLQVSVEHGRAISFDEYFMRALDVSHSLLAAYRQYVNDGGKASEGDDLATARLRRIKAERE
ncbi:MAG: nucleotidyl transferase AbiEii/AbiGii toxin family protein [Rickettsiales bacterium]|jgi:predicted nucleotidyltransferase component of viral defense system|nr:nucleotidyl transferase AbiEii/AbiGii toxin family protein [Rickettsiales bacterium]